MALGEVISKESLRLPCVHFDVSAEPVHNLASLQLVCESAVNPKRGRPFFPFESEWANPIVPQWYWAADDKWYQAVEIKKIRKASWWKRFVGPDDLMVADFKLKEIEGIGDHWMYYYRMLHDVLGGTRTLSEAQIKTARKELRLINHSKEMVEWLHRYV